MPEWLDDTFILAVLGIFGGGCGYLLMFCLKSRCHEVQCCCFTCKRQVLTGTELNSIRVS